MADSTYSLYDATIEMAMAAITSLQTMLTQAEAHSSIPLADARLIDDMNPLSFQVHYATFQAEALATKLSTPEAAHENTESHQSLDSYAKMQQRISRALHALEQTDKATCNRLGEQITSVVRRDDTIDVPIKALAGRLFMANIYFHVGMAYAILRKEGVPLGKRDWSRAFVSEYVPG